MQKILAPERKTESQVTHMTGFSSSDPPGSYVSCQRAFKAVNCKVPTATSKIPPNPPLLKGGLGGFLYVSRSLALSLFESALVSIKVSDPIRNGKDTNPAKIFVWRQSR